MFDTVGGLPLHPLLVHAAVVLLPLGALAVIATVLIRRWRPAYALPGVVLLGAGAVASFLAKESGEALARHEGMPRQHAALGDALPWVAFAETALAVAWYVLWRRGVGRTGATRATEASGRDTGGRSAEVLLGGLAVVGAVAAIVVTILTGHSGAVAVWAS